MLLNRFSASILDHLIQSLQGAPILWRRFATRVLHTICLLGLLEGELLAGDEVKLLLAGMHRVALRVPAMVSVGVHEALAVAALKLESPCHAAVAPIPQGAVALDVLRGLVDCVRRCIDGLGRRHLVRIEALFDVGVV